MFAPLFICFLHDFQGISSLIQDTNQGLIFKVMENSYIYGARCDTNALPTKNSFWMVVACKTCMDYTVATLQKFLIH